VEALVGPARGGREAMRRVDAFLADLPADVEPITRQVAGRAANFGPGTEAACACPMRSCSRPHSICAPIAW